MKIYNYEPDTGLFISESVADESPLEPGVHFLPAHATTIAPPAFDSEKELCTFANNKWTVSEKPETKQQTEEPVDYTSRNQEQLWQAATNYEQQYISGSALGLLTIGCIQGLPISKEIKFWLNTLWMGHYYPRKAQITGDAPITSDMLDFTLIGPMPHSIPELSAEVEGQIT